MRTRWIALAVVAVIGLTAFAPAPFSRPDRRRDRADVLDALQGKWTVTDKQRMGVNGILTKYSTEQQVIIEKDLWRFSRAGFGGGRAPRGKGGGPGGRAAYKLVLDTTRRPAEFRLKRTTASETVYMIGIVRTNGDTVTLLYCMGTLWRGQEQPGLPRSFAEIPQGWYLMTLTRDR